MAPAPSARLKVVPATPPVAAPELLLSQALNWASVAIWLTPLPKVVVFGTPLTLTISVLPEAPPSVAMLLNRLTDAPLPVRAPLLRPASVRTWALELASSIANDVSEILGGQRDAGAGRDVQQVRQLGDAGRGARGRGVADGGREIGERALRAVGQVAGVETINGAAIGDVDQDIAVVSDADAGRGGAGDRADRLALCRERQVDGLRRQVAALQAAKDLARGRAACGHAAVGGAGLWRCVCLLGGRFRRVDELAERGDAIAGRFQRLLALTDGVQQGVEVGGALAERLRGEEVDGVVERRIDLLAGRQPVLRRAHQLRGVLKGEQILPYAGERTMSLMASVSANDSRYRSGGHR